LKHGIVPQRVVVVDVLVAERDAEDALAQKRRLADRHHGRRKEPHLMNAD